MINLDTSYRTDILKWASGYKRGKISPVPDCPRSGRARGDSASALGAVCRRVPGSNPARNTHLLSPFLTFCPRSIGHSAGASGRIERFAMLIPRLNINFIARPQINLADCTGPLSVSGQSNDCPYVQNGRNAISCPGNPSFCPVTTRTV
jgi:hypothetical protein